MTGILIGRFAAGGAISGGGGGGSLSASPTSVSAAGSGLGHTFTGAVTASGGTSGYSWAITDVSQGSWSIPSGQASATPTIQVADVGPGDTASMTAVCTSGSNSVSVPFTYNNISGGGLQ